MDTAVWIVAALLAALFLVTGVAKITQPRLKMAEGPMEWAADVTDGQFRTVGVLELLGAAGLILPAVLGIAPTLVPLAAVGLALTMVGAIVAHLRLGETDRLAVPIVVLALALFVAVERFGAYPV
jgi:DoxX-like family